MGEEILGGGGVKKSSFYGDGESGVNENIVSLSTQNTIEICDYKCKLSSESTGCVCVCVCVCVSISLG